MYIPKSAKERVDQGIVKYVADDVDEVSVGEYVIFSGYSGQDVFIGSDGTDESEALIILNVDFVIATINIPDVVINDLWHKSPADLSLIYNELLIIDPTLSKATAQLITKLFVSPPHFYHATRRTAVESLGWAARDIPNEVRLKDRTSKPDSKVRRGV